MFGRAQFVAGRSLGRKATTTICIPNTSSKRFMDDEDRAEVEAFLERARCRRIGEVATPVRGAAAVAMAMATAPARGGGGAGSGGDGGVVGGSGGAVGGGAALESEIFADDSSDEWAALLE